MFGPCAKSPKLFLCLFALTVVLLGGIGLEKAMAKHGSPHEAKQAILVVAFGTSVPEAKKAYDEIDKRIAEAFPGMERRWAYTSGVIRKKLRSQGIVIDSPEVALAKLMEDGFSHVAVLSLHVIPGAEFHDLYMNARLFMQMSGGFKRVTFAMPLLSSSEDMADVVRAVTAAVPKERRPEEAVVLMGHGSEHHPADAIYTAMDALFQKQDRTMFLATVDGSPRFEDVLPVLESRKIKKAYLIPFMLVAGDHARNDMGGDEPDSWKSQLGAKGIAAIPVFRGLGEIPEVVDVWVRHLRSAVEALGTP